jgi:hypothetical protein
MGRTAALLLALAAMVAAPTPSPGGAITVAWPAPVGHFQPRARDIPLDISIASERAEQESRDRALDEKLRICRVIGRPQSTRTGIFRSSIAPRWAASSRDASRAERSLSTARITFV